MIADTSFLVALFLAEDELHESAKKELERCKEEQILILDRVIEETFTVLCYKKGLDFSISVVEKLNKNKKILIYRLDEKEFESIIELAKNVKKKLSFVDYSVIYLNIKIGERLLCFDNEIIKVVKNMNSL